MTPDARDDAAWMRIAIQASREAMAAGDMPYGAVLAGPPGTPLVVDSRGVLAGAAPTLTVDGPVLEDEGAAVLEAYVAEVGRGLRR